MLTQSRVVATARATTCARLERLDGLLAPRHRAQHHDLAGAGGVVFESFLYVVNV